MAEQFYPPFILIRLTAFLLMRVLISQMSKVFVMAEKSAGLLIMSPTWQQAASELTQTFGPRVEARVKEVARY